MNGSTRTVPTRTIQEVEMGKRRWQVLAVSGVAIALAAFTLESTAQRDRAPESASASGLPAPRYHHLHLNSVDPQRSIAWYANYWPSGTRATVAGLPAFAGDDLYLLYTKVDRPAPGAFDRNRHMSVPQSSFWTFGSSVTDPAGLVARLTAIDPKAFAFLPVFAHPADRTGVIRSALAPNGDELLTVAQLEARARQPVARDARSPRRQDFGYLLDPDGMLVEFNSSQSDHFWRHNHFWRERPLCAANWYAEHLGMELGPARDPKTGETWPSGPGSPASQGVGDRWNPCEAPAGEVSYPAFMPQGQIRSPIGIVRFANGSWSSYPRQCRDGRCGAGNDRPLTPSRGQVVDHVALAYPDLAPVLAHLKAAAIPIVRGPYPFGEGRAIMIEDPDGLGLELIESK
jgi:hypothetical protein